MTAITAYNFIAVVEFLTSSEHDKSYGRAFSWPVNAVLDGLASEQLSDRASNSEINANGHLNGSEKKKL